MSRRKRREMWWAAVISAVLTLGVILACDLAARVMGWVH